MTPLLPPLKSLQEATRRGRGWPLANIGRPRETMSPKRRTRRRRSPSLSKMKGLESIQRWSDLRGELHLVLCPNLVRLHDGASHKHRATYARKFTQSSPLFPI